MTTLKDRFQRGQEIRARFAGGAGRTFPGSVPVAYELAPDMYRITTECLYGSIWSRPGLDMKSRIVCALAAEVAQGRYDIFIRRMIEGALRKGVSRSEIMEVFMHLAFDIGVLPARSAMNIANTVFRSPEFSLSESPGP